MFDSDYPFGAFRVQWTTDTDHIDIELDGPTRPQRRHANRHRKLRQPVVTLRQCRSDARPLDTPGAIRSREARRRIRAARKAAR